MKYWKQIVSIFFVSIALIFISLHVFVIIKGKSLLINKLKDTFKRDVEVGSLTTSFLTTIEIKNIEVKGLFKIDEVIAGGGLYDIFRKNFRLSFLKVVRPVVTIEKALIQPTQEDSLIPTLIPSFIPGTADLEKKDDNKVKATDLYPLDIVKGRFLFPRFYINHLIVSEGALNLIDKSVGEEGLSIKIKHINMKVDNLNLTTSGYQITSFQLEGKMPWVEGQEEGTVEAQGWLNLFKKDIQANVKITDIDAIYLYPYYSQWVDLEKARIESAKLNFTSNIHGLNNNVAAECRLELTDIVRKPRPPEESQEKAEKIADVVLDIFKALDQGKIVLDFTIRTKMDSPQLGFSNIKMAFEEKIAKASKGEKSSIDTILALPVKLLEGTVKGATDISKAVIEGTFAVGNELKKGVEGAFKKEKKE